MVAVIGIDPGLVHTGLVRIELLPDLRRYWVEHEVVSGINLDLIEGWCQRRPADAIFVEAYRPRSNFNTDAEMIVGVRTLVKRLGATALDNTGVKKVVGQPLMELLGAWKYSTTTNHQDLRSAARIGLYGLLKDPEWNTVLATLVQDHVDGRPWSSV